ncbi:MAG: ATP-dependent Clp protease ATP-binding subunit [Deltaproteobacteria bacterium]|nr:ATP-dependent Clp protease ATP-binding subunit [Deltaproteobacteria bacterium]
MKRFVAISVLWSSCVFGSDWKLEKTFSQSTPAKLEKLAWVVRSAQHTTPAVEKRLLDLAVQTDEVRVHEAKGVGYALADLPALSEGKPYGGLILLLPGRTATEAIAEINARPEKVFLNEEGFYFTTVDGDDYNISFYHLTGAQREKLERLERVSFTRVRNGDVQVLMGAKGVTVQSPDQVKTVAPGGKKADASFVFSDFNSGSEDTIAQFNAVDVVKAVTEGHLDAFYDDDSLLSQVTSSLIQAKSHNVLLWGEQGVNPDAVVNALAARLAKGMVPEALKGWRLFRFNWAAFNTERWVDLGVKKMETVLSACRQKKIIMYFPDIDQLKGLGTGVSNPRNDIASVLVNDLALGRIVVIGTTSPSGRNYLSDTGNFIHSFRQVKVEPPKGEALVRIVTNAGQAQSHESHVVFEKEIISKIIELTDQFLYEEKQPSKSVRAVTDIAKKNATKDAQKPYVVTEQDVKEWIADKTGIKTLAENDPDKGLLRFLTPSVYQIEMNERLVGHTEAKEVIRKALVNIMGGANAREGNDGEMGVQVLFFIGPSGVGKSMVPEELARLLRKPQYGVNWNVKTIEGENFKNEGSVWSLTGPAPGYIGFKSEGGALYSWVKTNPQGVIVIEELDKTHPAIKDVLYKFLDDGVVQDAALNEARFTRGLIVLTSNFGSISEAKLKSSSQEWDEEFAARQCELIDDWDRWHIFKSEPQHHPEVKKYSNEDLRRAVITRLTKNNVLSPQFVGRIGESNIQILHHFTREELDQIGQKNLQEKAVDAFRKKYNIKVVFTDALKKMLIDRAWGKDGSVPFEQGARSILNVLKSDVLFPMNEKLLIEKDPSQKKNCTWIVDAVDREVVRFGQKVIEKEARITVQEAGS